MFLQCEQDTDFFYFLFYKFLCTVKWKFLSKHLRRFFILFYFLCDNQQILLINEHQLQTRNQNLNLLKS